MAKYVDLVSVRFSETGKLRIFEAPWCSQIEPGTMVLCEFGDDAEALGNVVDLCCSVEENSDEMNMIKHLAGVSKLNKVKAWFERKELNYDDAEVQ